MKRTTALSSLPLLLALLLADPSGAAVPLLWEEQPLTADRAEAARAALGTRNGDAVLAGSSLSPAGRVAFATRRGFHGELLWERTWPELGSAQPNGAAEAPNGDLLFAGTGSVGQFVSDTLLFRTDGAGNLLWSRSVPGGTGAVDLALRPDGSLVVVTGYYAGGRISAFDGAGNPLWVYAPGGDAKFRAALALPDGGILALGHAGPPLSGGWTGGVYYQTCGAGTAGGCGEALAVRLDRDGAPLWSRRYPSIPSTILGGAAPAPDGFVLVGQTLHDAGASGPSRRSDVALARIDLAGNLRWVRFHGASGIEDPAGLAPAGDGGYLLLSNSTACEPFSRFQGWFARVDGDGTVRRSQLAVPLGNGKNGVMATSLAAAPAGGFVLSATLSDGYFMLPYWNGDGSDGHLSAWGPDDGRVPAEPCDPFPPAPPPGGGTPPPPPKAVRIDVRPGTDRAEVNPGERGLVEVALFSAADFDAASVDLATLRFAGASPKANPDGKVVSNRRDVDRDGRADLVVRFRLDPDRFGVLLPETLTGRTREGREFAGSDGVLWKEPGRGR